MSEITRISLLDELKETRSSDRWGEFSREYGKLLRLWLVSQNVDPNDADDIQQETMAAVVQDLKKFEHNGREGAFRRWLRTILANRLRRMWEKRRRETPSVDLADLADSLEDTSNPLCQAWDLEHQNFILATLLNRARKRIDPATIELFERIVLHEESPEKIALEVGISLGAVRVRQHRVLRELQELGAGVLD